MLPMSAQRQPMPPYRARHRPRPLGKRTQFTLHSPRTRFLRSICVDAAILALIWLGFFWQLFVRRDHLIPYDLIDQHYMYQLAVHQALDAGDIPWWTSRILGGYPLSADPLAAVFYPPNLVMHLLSPGDWLPYIHLELQAALHVLWAAWGTYALARSLSGTRLGGMLAAMVFAFGGFMTWHLPHLSPLSSLSWLPWLLWALYWAYRRQDYRWTAGAGLAFAMLALAGHALTIVQSGYLVLGIASGLAIRSWPTNRRQALTDLARGMLVLALGVAVAAIQLLPAWELSSQTARASFSYAEATGSSYQPIWLATAVLPTFFSPTGPGPYWAGGDVAETSTYLGIVPLFLAGIALLRAPGRERGLVAAIGGIALVALIVALGSHTWLYRVVFDLLPGVDRIRRPLNAMAIAQLAVAVLAAFGVRLCLDVDTHAAHHRRRLQRWLGCAALGSLALWIGCNLIAVVLVGQAAQLSIFTVANGAFLILLWLGLSYLSLRGTAAGVISAAAAAGLLVGITLLDLGSAHVGVVYAQHDRHPESYIGPDWADAPGAADVRELQRLLIAHPGARMYSNRAGSIWDNGPLAWGLDSAYGYSVLWPQHYQQLHDVATADPGKPLINLLGIRYLVLSQPITTVYPQADTSRYQLRWQGAVQVYENPAAFPRVWTAHTAIALPEAETVAWMHANAAQLRTTVVVHEEVRGRSTTRAESSQDLVSWERPHDAEIQIQVSMAAAGWVVIGETYFPGWSATLNDEAVRVYRANHTQMAIWAPQGVHTITLRYQPRTLTTAMMLSATGGTGIILTGGLGIRAQRHHYGRSRANEALRHEGTRRTM